MIKPYKVKGQTIVGGLGQNISNAYGTDAEEELSKMLSEEVSSSINADIMKDLIHMGKIQKIKDELDRILKRIVRDNRLDDLLN